MADTARLLQCLRVNNPGDELKIVKSVSGSRTARISPYNYRGNGLAFRVGIFADEDTPEDLSNIASLTLKYQATFAAESAEAEVTVAAAAFESVTITKADFLAGTDWHAEFQFEDADMNPEMTAKKEEFWMVLKGVTDDGRSITFGTATFTLHEDDSETIAAPSGGGTAITNAQALALIQANVGWAFDFSIASGSAAAVTVSYGSTLGSVTRAGVLCASQDNADASVVEVEIVPGSVSTTQVQVRAKSDNHTGIKGTVVVR